MEHQDHSCAKKSRKPYTLTKVRESWTNDEHERFIKALQLYNRDWKKIESYVGTKTVVQIRSHAQKYFQKVLKSGSTDAIPPPRPKRRATDAPLASQASSAFPEAKYMRLMSEASTRGASTRDVDSDEGQQNSKPENATSLRSSDAVEATAQLESSRAIVSCQGLQQVYLFLASLFGQLPANHGAMLQRLNSRDRQMVLRLLKVMGEELAQQQQQPTESKETGTAGSGGNTVTTTAIACDAATTAAGAADQQMEAAAAAVADDAMQRSPLAREAVKHAKPAAAEPPTAVAGVHDAATSPVSAETGRSVGMVLEPPAAGENVEQQAPAAAAAGVGSSSRGMTAGQVVQPAAGAGREGDIAAASAAAQAGRSTAPGVSQQQKQCIAKDIQLQEAQMQSARASPSPDAVVTLTTGGLSQALQQQLWQQQLLEEQQQRRSQSTGPGDSSSDAAVPESGNSDAAAETTDAAMAGATTVATDVQQQQQVNWQ